MAHTMPPSKLQWICTTFMRMLPCISVVMLPEGKLTCDDGLQHSFPDPRRCAEADLAVLRVVVEASIKGAAIEEEDQLLRTCTCKGELLCLGIPVIQASYQEVKQYWHVYDYAVYTCMKADSSTLEVYCRHLHTCRRTSRCLLLAPAAEAQAERGLPG